MSEPLAIAVRQKSAKRRCRAPRQIRRNFIWGLASLLPLACAGTNVDSSAAATTYLCENGTSFSVEFLGPSARVITPGNIYHLNRRASSIGRKYSDGDVFFIQDEDRGVLTGAANGPYRRCAEG